MKKIYKDNYLEELKLTNGKQKDNPDFRVLSLGAGVQSSTLLLKMIEEEIQPADVCIFADTGNEPKEVYEYLDYLIKFTNNKIPIYQIMKSNIVEDSLAEAEIGTNKGFLTMPVYAQNEEGKKSMGRRQCTNDYKIQPLHRKIRELMGLKNLRGKSVEIVMGISFDEQQRAKTPKNQWQVHCYPFIPSEITRQDCLNYYDSKEVTRPPRSACIVCPYHSNAEWLDMKNNYPDDFKFAVEFDEKIRNKGKDGYKNYLHRTMIPLKDINFTVKPKGYQMTLELDDCEGMCGL